MKTLTKVIVFALLAIAVGFGVHYVLREMGVLYVTCSGLITTGGAATPASEKLQP